MRSFRSLAAGGKDIAADVAKEVFTQFASAFPEKFYWFMSKGYMPHEWQAAFHAASMPDNRLGRYRHLVAGRRGGKTTCAAWEILFYCLHPEVFHRDAHGAESSRPLYVWVLTEDHEVGRAARTEFRVAINKAGLLERKDFNWNKTEKTVEFENGSFVHFRTADNPGTLVGAGLDFLWMDEAAIIRNSDAWDTARPAMSDKLGCLIATTTPRGKNWYYEFFFSGEALKASNEFRVEYTSIDNPYFYAEEWAEVKKRMHPSMFKQEYMASFDSMSGLTLSGDWLHYYTLGKPDRIEDIQIPRDDSGKYRLRKYIGVDPSTGESNDEFAICCIGIAEDLSAGYLLEQWSGKILFPEQVDMIQTWHAKYRPELIGIEANAYQRVLAQQANRLEGFPGIVPVMSRGSKNERIISMSPVFKIGKFRIHQRHHKFIDQWVSFDGKRKDNKDDCLDSVEIALGVSGVLLPMLETGSLEPKILTIHDEAMAQIAGMKGRNRLIDPELGSEH